MVDLQHGPAVTMPVRVRYQECDQQGIVFNAHYLAYADMAMFEFCEAVLGSKNPAPARGIDVVVAESTLQYLRSARFDDELAVSLSVEHIGTTSLVLGIRMHRGQELLVQGTNRYVWVDAATLQPTAPPEDLRNAVVAAQHAASGAEA